MKKSSTELVIKEIVVANCGADASTRERYVYRESLRALVRLAKSEQILEMRKNMEKLGSSAIAPAVRRGTKDVLRAAASGQRSLSLLRDEQCE
jgi:hypothetical protein